MQMRINLPIQFGYWIILGCHKCMAVEIERKETVWLQTSAHRKLHRTARPMCTNWCQYGRVRNYCCFCCCSTCAANINKKINPSHSGNLWILFSIHGSSWNLNRRVFAQCKIETTSFDSTYKAHLKNDYVFLHWVETIVICGLMINARTKSRSTYSRW